MIDLIKKAVLTGVGLASLTSEKIENLSKEFITKGKMSEQEGEKFVEEMLGRAEESRDALKKQTEKMVSNAIEKMQLVRAKDIADLKAEIEKLRAEVSSLRNEKS